MNNIPWIEKYRPENFENIVLDEYNKILLKNIVEMNHFPNILLTFLPHLIFFYYFLPKQKLPSINVLD